MKKVICCMIILGGILLMPGCAGEQSSDVSEISGRNSDVSSDLESKMTGSGTQSLPESSDISGTVSENQEKLPSDMQTMDLTRAKNSGYLQLLPDGATPILPMTDTMFVFERMGSLYSKNTVLGEETLLLQGVILNLEETNAADVATISYFERIDDHRVAYEIHGYEGSCGIGVYDIAAGKDHRLKGPWHAAKVAGNHYIAEYLEHGNFSPENIVMMNLDDYTVEKIFNEPLSGQDREIESLSYSSDGTRAAWVTRIYKREEDRNYYEITLYSLFARKVLYNAPFDFYRTHTINWINIDREDKILFGRVSEFFHTGHLYELRFS